MKNYVELFLEGNEEYEPLWEIADGKLVLTIKDGDDYTNIKMTPLGFSELLYALQSHKLKGSSDAYLKRLKKCQRKK